MKKEYLKPEISVTEVLVESVILTLSLDGSATVGGDTDPNNPDPWG